MRRLVAVIACVAAIVCPTFHCGSSDVSVCGTLASAEEILVSQARCPLGLQCSAVLLYSWYWELNDLRPGETYNCTVPVNQTSLPSVIPSVKWECPVKRASIGLLSGTHPKACSDDSDCQLNSPYVKSPGCKCSLMHNFTQGFCQPLLDESVFDTYWEKCQIEGFLHGAEAVYWFLTSSYYVYYRSDLECSGVLWEFEALSAVTGASVLLWSAALLFSAVCV